MTANYGLSVAYRASDSSQMSIMSSSRSRKRSWSIGLWKRARQIEIVEAPVRLWSPGLVLFFSFLAVFPSAHFQILDEYAEDRITFNKQVYYAAIRSLNGTRIRTGKVYNASLPEDINHKSVELIQMVRLRTESLKRYGFQFNEITLPKGVITVQTPSSVVLVYRRFLQYRYYDSTLGRVFVAPVVGIVVYSGGGIFNYTKYIESELTIVASGLPIQVQLHSLRKISLDEVACVMYNNTVTGTIGVVKNLTSPTLCAWSILGDYSLLGPSKQGSHISLKTILGLIAGIVVVLMLLSLIGFLALWYGKKLHLAKMEHKSEQGETLNNTRVGDSRAPSAASTRTRPTLENVFVS